LVQTSDFSSVALDALLSISRNSCLKKHREQLETNKGILTAAIDRNVSIRDDKGLLSYTS